MKNKASEKVKQASAVLNKAIEEAQQLGLTVRVNINYYSIGKTGPLVKIEIYERIDY